MDIIYLYYGCAKMGWSGAYVSVVLFIFFLIALVKYFRVSDNGVCQHSCHPI